MTEPAVRNRRPSKRYSNTAIYKRGSLDPLLDERNRLRAPLLGVAFQVSASGLSLIATEHTTGGAHPRRILLEYPAYFDIELPDGREIQIEVREFDRVGDWISGVNVNVEGAASVPTDQRHLGMVRGDPLAFVGGGTGDADADDV